MERAQVVYKYAHDWCVCVCVQGMGGAQVVYKNAIDCFVQMGQKEGPKSLYRSSLISPRQRLLFTYSFPRISVSQLPPHRHTSLVHAPRQPIRLRLSNLSHYTL